MEEQYRKQIDLMNQALFDSGAKLSGQAEIMKHLAGITRSAVFLVDEKGVAVGSSVGLSGPPDYAALTTDNNALLSGLAEGESSYNEPCKVPEDMVKNKKIAAGKSTVSLVPVPGQRRPAVGLVLISAEKLDSAQMLAVEISAMLLAMVMARAAQEKKELALSNKALAEAAFGSLSYSELEAISEVLKSIKDDESVVVASKIADGLGITRSVIVNALRKLESAGIIESRSLGMKGTFIRVKNAEALAMLSARSLKANHFA